MDFIAGPRMPVFEHLRIPFLCGISDPSDFPREEDFGFTLADLGWRTAPPSQSRILRLQDEDRTMVSDLRHRIVDRSSTTPGYYDVPSLATTLAIPTPDIYRQGNFRGFPSRFGFDENAFQCDWNSSRYRKAWNDPTKSPQEIAVFIQAWLWFALLGEVLGKSVNYKDYVAKHGQDQEMTELQRMLVNLTRGTAGPQESSLHKLTLQHFLTNEEWKTWIDDLAALPSVQQKQRAQDIEYCLGQARKFCLLEATGALDHVPFSKRLACSVRALGLLLGEVADQRPELFGSKLGGDIGISRWGLSPLIVSRMRLFGSDEPLVPAVDRFFPSAMSSDWCPNDIARMSKFLPETAMYYMSTLRGQASTPGSIFGIGVTGALNEANLDHCHCTEASCSADNIDPDAYVTEHFPHCIDGECDFVGPDMDRVEEVLRRGKIPLIRFRSSHPSDGLFTGLDNGQEADFTAAQACPAWDMREAVRANNPDIPGIQAVEHTFDHCKLKSITYEFEVIEYDPAESKSQMDFIAVSHVWSDGMGNVHGNSLPACRLPFLQRAIWQCRAPIKTDKGRPGERTLKCYSSLIDEDEASILQSEPIMPFWLDTFCVPKTSGDAKTTALRLMGKTYSSASKVLVLDSGKFCGTSLGSNGWDVSFESHSYLDCVARIIGSKWMRRLWTLQEGLLAKELLFMFKEGPLEVRTIISGVRTYSKDLVPGHLIARQLARGLEQMLDFGKSNEGLYGQVLGTWNLSVGRSASKVGDTALCLASSIGLDAGDLYRVGHEARSKLFFSMLDEVPQSMIFNDAEKILDIGFRWADRTLATVLMDAHSSRAKVVHSPPSLEVRLPAYVAELALVSGPGALSGKGYKLEDSTGQCLNLQVTSTFDTSSPEEKTPYVLLMDKECLFDESEVEQARKVVILTWLDPVEDDIQSGRIEGFGVVTLSLEEPGEEESHPLVQLDQTVWRIS